VPVRAVTRAEARGMRKRRICPPRRGESPAALAAIEAGRELDADPEH
jgi:hypothetical protein